MRAGADHEGERLAEHEGTRTGVTPKPEQPVLNERAQAFAITPRQKMHSNAARLSYEPAADPRGGRHAYASRSTPIPKGGGAVTRAPYHKASLKKIHKEPYEILRVRDC